MSVNGVNSFSSAISGIGAEPKQSGGASGSQQFSSLIDKAIDKLDAQQKGAEQEIQKAVAGESPDIHRTIAALQTADLSFQFALQVRNKIVNAYEEIMRMQV